MGSLYLVRHGQASFGAEDYDQLSALGERQCEALGRHWQARGQRFDAVLIGTLRRHRQSFDAIVRGYHAAAATSSSESTQWPDAAVRPGLDEYDPVALVRAVYSGPLSEERTDESKRQHFRLLREGLLAWMAGRSQPVGMPSHATFAAGVTSALDQVRAEHVGHQVLVVSSGGPISHAVGHVLQAPAETIVELNLRIRNSSLTEFTFSGRRHSLVTFNTLPHLDSPERAGWVTFA